MLVVSATPNEALQARMGRARHCRGTCGAICGQEDRHEERNAGRRQEVSARTNADDRRRPGRLQGGRGNNCLFFPINPGDEEASWKRLLRRRDRRSSHGTFAGEYQQKLLAEFDAYLPRTPAVEAVRRELIPFSRGTCAACNQQRLQRRNHKPWHELCDFGLIGLAVMGENLALNIESRGYRVAVFNRTTSVVDELHRRPCQGQEVRRLPFARRAGQDRSSTPRKVMMMVKAGPAVDDLIEQLMPLLSPGDVIIDGGNTLLRRHRTPHASMSKRRACCSSAPASPAAKKGRCSAPA